MASNPSWIDYRNNAFEIVNLTKIHGEPTFESICVLQREIIINSQCVHTHLGGGAHGHMGLVMSPQEYAMHSNAAYLRLVHPGPLLIPPGVTQQFADTLREQHKEQVCLFCEVQGVDQALRQQIATAIEPQYLEAFHDDATGRIQMSVAALIQQLYRVYGKVTPQKLQDQTEKVRQMVFDPVNPIDGIFTAIDDLVHYVITANSPFTQPQIINMAYLILNKTGLFQRWILDWNARQPQQKTWTNFKLHFREAQQQLRETSTLQQQQSQFQANAVQEIISELKNELRSVTTSTIDTYTDIPSMNSVSTMSNDTAASLSVMQSEISSLRDMLHNMSRAPPPSLPAWQPPFHPNIQYNPHYCNQVAPPPMQSSP